MGKYKEIDILRGDLGGYPEAAWEEKMREWELDEPTKRLVRDYHRRLQAQATGAPPALADPGPAAR